MALSLTVLGGSAAWPNPGQGCSAYLVQDGTTSILLDCGPNTLLELRKHIDYRHLDAIVISHCHADHMLDLVPYRYGLTYGPGERTPNIPVWLPPGGLDRMELLGRAFDGQGEPHSSFWAPAFDLAQFDPDEGLTIGSLSLHFTLTQHFIPCYAMRVDDQSGATLFYSSDSGTIQPLKALADGASMVIAEATLDQHDDTPEPERGHLRPSDAGQLANSAGAETLILTHLWSERPDIDVEQGAAEHFDGRIMIAKPGLRIDV